MLTIGIMVIEYGTGGVVLYFISSSTYLCVCCFF